MRIFRLNVLFYHRLITGLHNGHTIIGRNLQAIPLLEDKEDRDILMTMDTVLSIDGYVPDYLMALVFVVEYQVGILHQKNAHLDPKAILAATQSKDPDNIISTATLGVCVYVPSDGKLIFTRNAPPKTSEDEGVDIEIPLLKDDTCTLLSPSPVIFDAKEEAIKPTDSVAESKVGASKDGLSFVGGTKASIMTSSTLALRKTNALKDSAAPSESDTMLGFDMKIIHPKYGELKHEQNTEDLLTMVDKVGLYVAGDGEMIAAGSDKEDEGPDDLPTIKEETKFDDKSRFHKRQRKVKKTESKFDDDASSVAESIITGDSDRSSLRIDPFFYGGRRGAEESEVDDRVSERSADFSERVPKREYRGRSVLGQAMLNAKLGARRGDAEFDDRDNAAERLYVASKSMVPLRGNEYFMRGLSRGAKARLNRHGIQDAIADSPYAELASGYNLISRVPTGKRAMDIEMEAFDKLSVHEINIQFGGFRAGGNTGMTVLPKEASTAFRAVFFSFQFYSCAPTRTEALRLLTADAGEVSVLVRDDPNVRNEPPLTLRFVIDCSRSSPFEAIEFTDYLAHKSLYVDMWDADSLLHIGTFGIPLRMLMRQGQPMVKHAIECDVINAEIVAPSHSGVTVLSIMENGPIVGEIVGSVNAIIANYGHEGKGPNKMVDKSYPVVPIEGLNWRAHGVDRPTQPNGPANRPKNSVRAKPLSATSPELSRALTDLRHTSHGGGASYRSLASARGFGSGSTLNYDEVVTIFKRFQGVTKGSVQYAGGLMTLMELPSMAIVLKKITRIYKLYGDSIAFKAELLRHANSSEELRGADLEEVLRVVAERTGVKLKPEECILFQQKLLNDDENGTVSATKVVTYISQEADRQDWVLVNNRLRLCAQKAELDGVDVEQMLADYDPKGEHFISTRKLKDFLTQLATYGKLSSADINLSCRVFARHSRGIDADRDPVSLAEVMAAFGKDYVGNLQARVQKLLQDNMPEVKYILRLLNDGNDNAVAGFYPYDRVEAVFRAIGVYSILSHNQVKGIIRKMDIKSSGNVSAAQVLSYLGVPFKASDLPSALNMETIDKEKLTAEYLLKLLLEKARSNGVAVDQAFRHFDANGDGFISRQELEEGLSKLNIFNEIPGWKNEIPAIVRKFDSSGDGMVSLPEFFAHLGIKDYAPNIIQRLTKIFAVATMKGLSFKDIFMELDTDQSGSIDEQELLEGLKKLGTFDGVTAKDAAAVVAQFDKNGDKHISINEFISYFSERVELVVKQRKIVNGLKVAKRFREVMKAAQGKGAAVKDIFDHLDKDKGGSISKNELATALSSLPHLKSLTSSDIDELLNAIDADNSGDITLDEFELFVNGELSRSKAGEIVEKKSFIEQVRETFGAAQSKGLTFEEFFHLVDKDRSGRITLEELESLIRRIPSFKNVSKNEIEKLFTAIDTDKSELISVEEFKEFIKTGRVEFERHKSERHLHIDEKENMIKRHEENDEENDPGNRVNDVKEKFIRHMRRISEIDGSLRGLLAYLDDDEDGLIKVSALMSLLRRESVFSTISERQVEDLLTPFIIPKEQLQLVPFLRFLEGHQREPRLIYADLDEDNSALHKIHEQDYHFSRDPEILAVEKKLRAFGRVLARKGVDVENEFKAFDVAGNGCIPRTDFVKVLSKLGMYLLEEGKVLKEGISPVDDLRRKQVTQIRQVKGLEGTYVRNVPNLARKMFMNEDLSSGDFKVSISFPLTLSPLTAP